MQRHAAIKRKAKEIQPRQQSQIYRYFMTSRQNKHAWPYNGFLPLQFLILKFQRIDSVQMPPETNKLSAREIPIIAAAGNNATQTHRWIDAVITLQIALIVQYRFHA